MFAAALVLLAVAIGIVAVGYATNRERVASPELEQRLERFGSINLPTADPDATAPRSSHQIAQALDAMVRNRPLGLNMALSLARADLRLTVGELLIIRIGAALGGFLLGFVLGRGLTQPVLGIIVGLIVGVVGWMAPHWYVSHRAKKRLKTFVGQLGDTITLMANSLRAGYSLLQTMEMVSRESPPPMGQEFKRVVREVGLGLTPQQAMEHMLRRVPSEDLDLLVTAINIQHEVGGNLAQILEVIGETIRERVRVKGEISVLTAQQSLSGYIVAALPIGLAGILFVINPGYLNELFAWPWICLPIAGVVLIGLGFLVMRKIVQIDV